MMESKFLKSEISDVDSLTRSLKKAVRAKTEYNNSESSRVLSISEQIILDAAGGAGT